MTDPVVQAFGRPEDVPDADEGTGNPYVLAPLLNDAEFALLLWREGHTDHETGIRLYRALEGFVRYVRFTTRGAS